MKKQFVVNFFKSTLTQSLIGLLMMGVLTSSVFAETEHNEFIDSIRSVEQVKEQLRQMFQQRDECKVGSCWNNSSTIICETVAALDVQVNGQIVGGMTSVGSAGNIPISATDLELMKLIFSQCKPTNYQYWNWPMLLHVVYAPTQEVDQKIRQGLGITP